MCLVGWDDRWRCGEATRGAEILWTEGSGQALLCAGILEHVVGHGAGVVTECLGWKGVACVHRWARGLSRTVKLEWKDGEEMLKRLSTGVLGDTVSSFSEANVAVLVEEPTLELGGGNPTIPQSSDVTAISPTRCRSEMEWEAVLTPRARQSPYVVRHMH